MRHARLMEESMSYDDREGRPRTGSGRSVNLSGGGQRGSRGRIPLQGTYHGPRGTRTRTSASRHIPSSGPGYPLRSRNINFSSGRARRLSANRRLIILAVIALLVVILLVVGISSCVRGCSSSQPASGGSSNPIDSRVAAGVNEELTRQFATELNRGDKLAEIAANADKYENQGLLELALSEPAAIDFVAAYPESTKEAQPYEDEVTKGTVPELYCWDERWGNVDYAGSPLALTGSGPTALSMAYMALTGKGDRTPADFAQAITDAEMSSGDSLMAGSFLSDSLKDYGLTCSTYTSNEENLVQVLDTGTYLLVEAAADTLTDSAHWIVLVTEDSDGSLVVYDPTSPEVSSHTWDPATIAGVGNTLYAISAAEADDTAE